jgi:single-strand DNA-binding protein
MLPTITGTGRLVSDIELRYTSGGKPVAQARIAFSDRKRQDDGTWIDGDKVFLDASVWGEEAERLAECLPRGTEVLVSGKLRQREYEAKDGSKRTIFELQFATIAPTLKYAAVSVRKAERNSSGQQSSGQQGGAVYDDPWSQPAASGGQRASGGSSFGDEPPF